MAHSALRANPQQALAVYAEPLAVGRRVAVIGDASIGLGTLLAELGARAVFVWDPDPERARGEAAHAPTGVTVRALSPEALDPRIGTLDLVVVTNLDLFEDPEDLIASVRRLVGTDGVALVSAPNREASENASASEGPSGLDYYELFDLVAREFDDVTMIAQLPFCGITLVELGEREGAPAEVSVDTQLAGGQRIPDAFVAVASQRGGAHVDAYAIVELPFAPWVTPPHITHAEGAAAPVQSHTRVDALERQLDELRARLAVSEPQLARMAETQASEVARYEDALRERSHAVRLLEAEIERRDRMVRELVETLEEARAAAAPVPAGARDSEPPERQALIQENSELHQKLDALALELARREGQAQANEWSIEELQARLEQSRPLERELAAALDELDVLRRALAQEHAARMQAKCAETEAATEKAAPEV